MTTQQEPLNEFDRVPSGDSLQMDKLEDWQLQIKYDTMKSQFQIFKDNLKLYFGHEKFKQLFGDE